MVCCVLKKQRIIFIICVKKRGGSVDCNLSILKTEFFFILWKENNVYIYCIVLLSIEITKYNLSTQQHNFFYNISTKIKVMLWNIRHFQRLHNMFWLFLYPQWLLNQHLAQVVVYLINFEVLYLQQQFKHSFVVKIGCIMDQFQLILEAW